MQVKKEKSVFICALSEPIDFVANVPSYSDIRQLFPFQKFEKVKSINAYCDKGKINMLGDFLDLNGNALQAIRAVPAPPVTSINPIICLETGNQVFFENIKCGGVLFYEFNSAIDLIGARIYLSIEILVESIENEM